MNNNNNNKNPSFPHIPSHPSSLFTWDFLPPSLYKNQNPDFIDLTSPNSKAGNLSQASKTIQKQPISPQKSRKRTPWTASEDEQVRLLVSQHGQKWTKIASYIPNRTGKQVRDRYMYILTSNVNNNSWTDEEDQAIIGMLQEVGPQWGKIAEALNNRTDIQVVNRYHIFLKNQGVTSPETSADLRDMISYEEEKNDFFDWRQLEFDL